jgi:diguanylate cyclase (GGDEF)-like protein/PAS domain S-box-containing protein
MKPPSYEDLQRRLAEFEETLAAIRAGEVDAVVVDGPSGVRTYTLQGADSFYRVLIEQMPEGAAAIRPDGTIVYANGTLADMLGLPLETVIGANLHRFVAAEGIGDLLRAGDSERAIDVVMTAANGDPVDIALSVRPVEGALCVLAVDLTQRKRDEEALRRAEERFRGAFDNAPIGIALLDPDRRVLRVNPALCTILGQPAEELLGAPLPLDLTAEGPVQIDAEARWVEVSVSAISEGDAVQQLIVQVQDVSERRRHEEQLRHVADHDHLTGLLNRRGFETAMDTHLADAARYGTPGALILLDVDHFKYVNDSRGHEVGDRVLVAVAEALRRRLRDADVLARLGGDEFAVLLTHAEADVARTVAEAVVATVREVEVPELVGLRQLTVSAGVALVDGSDRSVGELFSRADLAMYDAKEAGRDGVVVFDTEENGSETQLRLTWLRRIKDALDWGTLMLDAQPIVALDDGHLAARELLVRIPGTDGRPVPAGTWFAVAERYDLATAIDEWVIRRALELLRGPGATRLNINVSGASIGHESLLRALRDGLAAGDVDASRLTIEITETAAIGNIAAAARFAEQVHELGCRLAMDDFGAGFGSFYYLKHLPFDDIKIDGEFVRDSVGDPRDQAIIRAMVDVAGTFGRRTVAEYIEDAATMDLMRSFGVDLAQGYHVGRPQPLVQPPAS